MTVHTPSPYHPGHTSCGHRIEDVSVVGKVDCPACIDTNQSWHMAGLVCDLPELILKQRDLLGLTDEVICTRAGISKTTWLRVLRDCSKVSVDTIVRIGWAVEMNLSIVPTPPSEQS